MKENQAIQADTLTRAELIDALIVHLNLEKHDAARLVTLFYEELVSALKQGESVHLTGFGNLDIKSKSARRGRNPKTGKEYMISARKTVTFHAGTKLKSELKVLA